MAGPKIPWKRPPRPPQPPRRRQRPGCCTACLGWGSVFGRRCWDCRGTGHPHDEVDRCPPAPVRCDTCVGTGELYVTSNQSDSLHTVGLLPPEPNRTITCWTCRGSGMTMPG